jgi:S-adenosylmethionine synthetase
MDVSSFLRGLPGGQTLNSAKDRMLAKGAMAHCNKHLERYGTVLDLQLDIVTRALSVTLMLKGETSPVDIHVREYAFATVEGKSVLVIDGNKIDTSREWLTNVIRDHVGQKNLTVPDSLEWVVRLLN